jgi:hypothetical protein
MFMLRIPDGHLAANSPVGWFRTIAVMPGRIPPTLMSRRTYDATEADAVINGLLAEVDHVRAELDEATARIRDLENRPTSDTAGTVLGRAMILVQLSADEILTEAKAQAAAIVARAEREAASFPPAPSPPAPSRSATGSAMLADLEKRIGAIRAKLVGEEPLAEVPGSDGKAPEDRAADEASPALREPQDAAWDCVDVQPTATPPWVRGDRTDVESDTDYFAALRQALDDGEPLGPLDERTGPKLNGKRHLGPVLRGLPILLAASAFTAAVAIRPF